MALTSAGALKAYIEGLGLSLSAYRDFAPVSATRPYITIHESLAIAPETLHGPDSAQVGVEIAQVDVWYPLRAADTGATADAPSTVASLVRSLQGASIPQYGSPLKMVYACLVRNVNRLVELQNDLVGYHITLHLWREL
jgi:hypothetical protein